MPDGAATGAFEPVTVAADFIVGEVERVMVDVIGGCVLGDRFTVRSQDGVKVRLGDVFSETVLSDLFVAEPYSENARIDEANVFALQGKGFFTHSG